jgi:membrane fusion protein, multidrug efflux system
VVDSKAGDGGEKAMTVRQQIVRLGTRKGDFVEVVSGLKAGDTIVTSGVFRLRPGTSVKINNSLAPDAQVAPKTTDS